MAQWAPAGDSGWRSRSRERPATKSSNCADCRRDRLGRVSRLGRLLDAPWQDWQPELLAVASMAILSVQLRQRGSPESKPVDAPIVDEAATDG
ncbi:DUF6766 family protein [Streptomyces sp. NPDC005065]|uniref:DUF6766 family protein n=1 Tax=Streptomyces sp. NPDC005065 TaxID=3154461 RepID=UPI0033B81AB4